MSTGGGSSPQPVLRTFDNRLNRVMIAKERQESHPRDPIKDATLTALKSLLQPLLKLTLDSGVTVAEFNRVVRESAVRLARTRLRQQTGRESKSSLAITTGLSRSEVARILASLNSPRQAKFEELPARRVLAAWFESRSFLAPNGSPADLPIFGKRRSFQHLVERYGGGIPVRAMLDELLHINAVQRLDNQKIRPKTRIPATSSISPKSIEILGERGRDLLEALMHNARNSNPLFEETFCFLDADPETLSSIRRDISEQGKSFIAGARSLLNQYQRRGGAGGRNDLKKHRLGVAAFYFHEEISVLGDKLPLEQLPRRKNLRRR
jgi:hypothetical protein